MARTLSGTSVLSSVKSNSSEQSPGKITLLWLPFCGLSSSRTQANSVFHPLSSEASMLTEFWEWDLTSAPPTHQVAASAATEQTELRQCWEHSGSNLFTSEQDSVR